MNDRAEKGWVLDTLLSLVLNPYTVYPWHLSPSSSKQSLLCFHVLCIWFACVYMCFFYLDSILWEKTQDLSFWVCLISFNMWISSIHFLANNIILLCSLGKTLIYIMYFLYPFICYKHLCWLHRLATVKSAAIKTMSTYSPSASFMYSEAQLHQMLLLLSIFLWTGRADGLIYILPHK